MATSQLRITIPSQLQDLLYTKSDRYGFSMSTYVKNLILNDVKDDSIPTFKMNSKLEKIADQALKDYKEGKTHRIKNLNDLDDFLDSV